MTDHITPQAADGSQPRKLKLIETAPLSSLIERALEKVLRDSLPDLDSAKREQVVTDARRSLLGLLKHEGRAIRGVSKQQFMQQLERSKNDTLLERNRALVELEELRQKTLKYRDELEDEEEASLADREAEAARVHDEGLRRRIKRLFELSGGQAPQPPAQAPLQNKVIALAVESARDERDRVYAEFSQMIGEHLRQFELLERRISKLSKALEYTEAELKRLAHLKADDLEELEAGVASVFRMVQGFYEEDEKGDMKQNMMNAVFRQNVGMRGGR